MITFLRTNSENPDFINLVRDLDADLAERDGLEHSFYHQFNKLNKIKHAVVAYADNVPVGCGAIKEFDSQTMEVKRMFVIPSSRSKGIASGVLFELERWAAELGYAKCVLETGKRQPEAIALYKRSGYESISNYGPYVGIENSVCFLKRLKVES